MKDIAKIIDAAIVEMLRGEIPLSMAVEQFEARYIKAALNRRRYNVTKTARLLGVHRNTLHNKLRLR